MSRKNIIFTGGGSGGHLIPAVTLIKELQKKGDYNLFYVGSKKAIESEVIPSLGIPYKAITTGKLRRYFSIENIKDIFKVFWGTVQSIFYMLSFRSRDTVVFSCGGFVSVPVVISAKLTGKRVYVHEQTTKVGLANRIASNFCDQVFVSFKESMQYFPKTKVIFSGYPLREECFTEEVSSKVEIEGIDLKKLEKPILFLTGGGNGAKIINDLIKENFEELCSKYFIVHQVGKIFIDEYSLLKSENYLPVAFVKDEMIDLFKLAKVVVSRAGAGTVCELMALGKKTLLIPLKIAQKNEQYHNAMAAHKEIGSIVIEEDQLKEVNFVSEIEKIDGKRVESQIKNGREFLLDHLQKILN